MPGRIARIVGVAVGGLVTAPLCFAEPRWCSITGRGPNDTVVYPPIAKAARVQGNVASRIVYTPSGEVVRVEPIWGPVMLVNSVHDQLMRWNPRTDATGSEFCETLVAFSFRFRFRFPDDPEIPLQPVVHLSSTLSIEVVSEEGLALIDPAADITRNPFRVVVYRTRRFFRSVFHRDNLK